MLRLRDVTPTNLLLSPPLPLLYRLRRWITVAPKSGPPLGSILNGSPNPNRPRSPSLLRNRFSPLPSWKATQWLTWSAWYRWSPPAHLSGSTSLVRVPRVVPVLARAAPRGPWVRLPGFCSRLRMYRRQGRPVCFNLQCFDCEIYHNIQHVWNLFKIGVLYAPPQYKNKIFLKYTKERQRNLSILVPKHSCLIFPSIFPSWYVAYGTLLFSMNVT